MGNMAPFLLEIKSGRNKMCLNREMYTYQDMESVGKMVQVSIQKVANWLLRKVSVSE